MTTNETPIDQSPATVFDALDTEWRTTQWVARQLGLTWRAGSADLSPLRNTLYALATLNPDVEHRPRRNGHLWRRTR